jgi:phosphoglycolate phosphatase-like HAD superfamily hydrolase
VYRGDGLHLHEPLIIEKATLQRLARHYTLAIATGRPAAEAVLPLRRNGLTSLFSRVYTLDDCLAAEKKIREESGDTVTLSKPSPFMLDSIVEELDARKQLYYVGDMPDDMKAAAASRHAFKSVGFLAASPDRYRLRADLERAGADVIRETPSELEDYFLGST